MEIQLFLTAQKLRGLILELYNPTRGTVFIYIGVAILVITLRRMGRRRKG